jgi:hypothetical protein
MIDLNGCKKKTFLLVLEARGIDPQIVPSDASFISQLVEQIRPILRFPRAEYEMFFCHFLLHHFNHIRLFKHIVGSFSAFGSPLTCVILRLLAGIWYRFRTGGRYCFCVDE